MDFKVDFRATNKKNVIDSSDDYFHDSLILNFFDKMEKKKKLKMSNPISQRSK